jgi:hypothetical protein
MGLFKPFAAYVAYSVNIELISSTLCVKKNEVNNCCKGKCYLTKQVKKESKEESQQKVPTVKTIQEECVMNELVAYFPQLGSKQLFPDPCYSLSNVCLQLTVPPPQTAS